MRESLLLLLICLLLPLQGQAGTLAGRVTNVPDANRLELLTEDGRRITVKLLGLAQPEPDNRRWSNIARRHLQMLVAGRSVSVERTFHSRQGVILGEVRHGGADVGLRMIEAGMAVVDSKASLPPAQKKRYQQAQQEARLRGMGYWRSVR